jgi:hypothetical protein
MVFNKKTTIAHNRKSQVSVFFIFGILVIIFVVVGFVTYKYLNPTPDSTINQERSIDANFVSEHIQSCIFKAKPVIKQIAKNGGEYEYSMEPLMYNGVKYNYWCLYDSQSGCQNRVFSKKKLEAEFNTRLKPIIDACINLSNFEAMGYEVTSSPTTIETAVAPLDITIFVRKELVFVKGEERFEVKDVSRKIELPVGRLFEVANLILNEEIANDYFDKDAWMKNHSAEFRIEKHKPYPNKVYHVAKYTPSTDEWVEVNFAIEGTITVSDLLGDFSVNPTGWCKEDDMCLFNPISYRCSNFSSTNCKDLSVESYPLCNGSSCKDCGIHKHGEEWCDYEGPTGGGDDFVGTRHYLKSCINGVIFTEECRDYREEICVSSGTTNSMCRPNRWKTCMSQTDESSCEDEDKRDCIWLDTSQYFDKSKYSAGDEKIKCYPQVPPAFQYWGFGGAEVCQMNNEFIDCDGLSCPQAWSDVSLYTCDKLGDCGNSYTVSGAINNYSFFTTDLIDSPTGPDTKSIVTPRWLVGYDRDVLSLGQMSYSKERFSSNVFDCTDCTTEDMATRMGEYMAWIESLDEDELILDYIEDEKVHYHTRHFTMCMPFMMSEESEDCASCHSDPTLACTEYKCKSIGSNCQFYIDNGYGKCMKLDTTETSNPYILTNTLRGSPYNSFTSELFGGDIMGMTLTSTVPAFSYFKISFNTSEPTVCRMSPVPFLTNDILPITLSSTTEGSTFNISHEFTITAFPSDYVLADIGDLTEISSYMQFLNIVQMESIVDAMFVNMTATITAAAEAADKDPAPLIAPIQDMEEYWSTDLKPAIDDGYNYFYNYILAAINGIEVNKMYSFFNCMDSSGNENEDQFFVGYQIADDFEEPELLSFNIVHDLTTTQINVTMNEPVQCMGSFVYGQAYPDMDYDMVCGDFFSGMVSGYTCTVTVPRSACRSTFYVRCRDKTFLDDYTQANINDPAIQIPVNC